MEISMIEVRPEEEEAVNMAIMESQWPSLYKGELYLYIQFKDHLNRVNLDKLERKEEPKLELVVDYRTEELPLEMCPFLEISGKKYMVGGERTHKIPDTKYDWEYQLNWEVCRPSDALNSHVFVLDPFEEKITFDPSFPRANAAKTDARVLATIDQKVYVLGTRPYYYWGVLPDPAFECFHIYENRWEALPTPPDYYDPPMMRSVALRYFYHFVVGRKIYVNTFQALFCFDVDEPSKGWQWVGDLRWRIDFDHSDGEEELGHEPDDDDLAPFTSAYPYHSICFVEPGKSGLAVGYTTKGLVRYVFDHCGNLIFQQLLQHHNAHLPSPN